MPKTFCEWNVEQAWLLPYLPQSDDVISRPTLILNVKIERLKKKCLQLP